MTDDVVGKRMVAGFLFSGSRVLLVNKKQPKWMDGLWNGIGGVIESNETPPEAMEREFLEETGCVERLAWRHFCTEIEPFGAYVFFFCADLPSSALTRGLFPVVNDVDESLQLAHVNDVGWMGCVGNLRWLIPLARDWRGLEPVVVTARGDIREKATW